MTIRSGCVFYSRCNIGTVGTNKNIVNTNAAPVPCVCRVPSLHSHHDRWSDDYVVMVVMGQFRLKPAVSRFVCSSECTPLGWREKLDVFVYYT